jgi:hypothetical protein
MKNRLWAFVLLPLLFSCDQIQAATHPNNAAPSHQTDARYSFSYRVTSIDRTVNEYPSLGNKTVSFNGNIEFEQTAPQEPGNFMLLGKLRTEDALGTEETDTVILIEHGRGQHQGVLRSHYDMPLRDATPELPTDHVTFTLTGVVPVESGAITRANDVAQTEPTQPGRDASQR